MSESSDDAYLEISARDSRPTLMGTPTNLEFNLDPLHDMDPSAEIGAVDASGHENRHEESAKLALANYRYFLLVSQPAAAAGSYHELEVPVEVIRICQENDSAVGVGGKSMRLERLSDAPAHRQGRLRGRVLEVVVNGKYGKDILSRLDRRESEDITNREFWERLLPTKEGARDDAAGSIRRISEPFDINWL